MTRSSSPRWNGKPVVVLAALCLAGCRAPNADIPDLTTFSGSTMGTWYHVKLVCPMESQTADRLAKAVGQRLQAIDHAMSTYLPDSEISRFNHQRGTDWFEVSADTATVVAAAEQLSARTGGAFDVTVGPLVNLWSFGPGDRPRRVPADEEIAAAKAQVGFRLVRVRTEPPALRKAQPDVSLDLSGIAKGFAVDAVAQLLEDRGITRYMVEIGGEVRTGGRKPDGTPWRIGIEKPVAATRAIQEVVELEDRALATSGDYRNYFEQDGRRYSHTIDPHTGRPIQHRLASVSVIADRCMDADALATALTVMGPEEAFRFAQQGGIDVLLIVRQSDRFVEKATAGFLTHIPSRQAKP